MGDAPVTARNNRPRRRSAAASRGAHRAVVGADDAKYRLLYASMTDAFVSVDMRRGRIIEFNRAYQEMLGYSEAELRRKTYVDLTPKRWHAMEAAIVRDQILARGYSDVYEKEYRRKDGTIFPIELRTCILPDAEGKPVAMWAIIRDITERKQLEERTRQSEASYRLMAETVPHLTWRSEPQGGAIEFNRRWHAYTGLTPEASRGSGWMRALHPDDRERIVRRITDDVSGGSLYQTEYRLRRASDNAYRWHTARALPLKDARGHILCWFGCATDIDDLVRAQAALRASHRTLEKKVAERTAQLRALAHRLVSVQRDERRRLAQVLHEDLQQMLAGARYALRGVSKHATPRSKCRDAADTVDTILDRAIQLTRSVAVDMRPQALCESGMDAAVRWIAADMEQTLGLRVLVDVGPAIKDVDEDLRLCIFQAVRELLFNVHKHAGVRAARVRIKPLGRSGISVEISDRGAGFDPSCAGTVGALGLFAVREQVAAQGGRVRITSAPGKGTRVRLTFPARSTP